MRRQVSFISWTGRRYALFFFLMQKGKLTNLSVQKQELIKYKGLQVAPAELEALLLSNPKIFDAAVIGVDSPDEGTEVPRAYVIANKNEISETEIKDFVKQRVAGHKQLRGGVVFVKVIPKSPSGKILRKDLRKMAKAGQRKEGSKL